MLKPVVAPTITFTHFAFDTAYLLWVVLVLLLTFCFGFETNRWAFDDYLGVVRILSGPGTRTGL